MTNFQFRLADCMKQTHFFLFWWCHHDSLICVIKVKFILSNFKSKYFVTDKLISFYQLIFIFFSISNHVVNRGQNFSPTSYTIIWTMPVRMVVKPNRSVNRKYPKQAVRNWWNTYVGTLENGAGEIFQKLFLSKSTMLKMLVMVPRPVRILSDFAS